MLVATLTALVALAASATLAGCGRSDRPRHRQGPRRDDRRRHGGRARGDTRRLAGRGHNHSSRGEAGRLRTGARRGRERGRQLAHRRRLAAGPRPGRPVRPGAGRSPAGARRPPEDLRRGVTDDGEGQRTRETVAPLAAALGIPVDTDLGRGDEKKLVKDVLAQPGATLISWQHGGIPDDRRGLPRPSHRRHPKSGPTTGSTWSGRCTRTTDGWHFTQTPELVLPQDSTGVIEN